jgi:hypothetical protein
MFRRRKTSLPVLRIIHHPPCSSVGAWYICMEKIPDVSLDKVIERLELPVNILLDHSVGRRIIRFDIGDNGQRMGLHP